MKIRLVFFSCLGLLASFPLARGFQSPAREPLPNFDSRSSAQPPSAAQEQAAASLKQRIPSARVDRDALLGVARWVTAQRDFLTGPNGRGKGVTPAHVDALPLNDPHRVIKAFVNEHSALFGHDATALAAAKVARDYVTEHNGMRTVVWQQDVDDIPVYDGVFMAHVTAKGELVSVSSHFVPDAPNAAAHGHPNHRSLVSNPTISATKAVGIAARHLDSSFDDSSLQLGAASAPDKHQSFRAPGLKGDCYIQLRWLPTGRDSMRLCWRVDLTARSRPEMYSVLVDAETGEILVRRCLTRYIKPATYNVYISDSPSPFSPGLSTPTGFQPPTVPRQLVTLSALNTNASPNGWINDADNETRGNNVDAHTDRNDDDVPDLPRPQGVGAARIFDFPLNLAQAPSSYTNAAVVNLFYWNNFMHDKLYELGFTEAAGNFQVSNFGRGGVAGDPVFADGQDGGDTDNANFLALPDGIPGRMQMYVFTGPTPDRDGDLDAEIMCHEYTHGLSERLVGGGVGIFALQSAGMAEGWSDFYALALLSEESDDLNGRYR